MCMLEMATSEYPYNECMGPAQIYKKVPIRHSTYYAIFCEWHWETSKYYVNLRMNLIKSDVVGTRYWRFSTLKCQFLFLKIANTSFIKLMTIGQKNLTSQGRRNVWKSGGHIILGGDNVPPLVEIGLTDLTKSGRHVLPAPTSDRPVYMYICIYFLTTS